MGYLRPVLMMNSTKWLMDKLLISVNNKSLSSTKIYGQKAHNSKKNSLNLIWTKVMLSNEVLTDHMRLKKNKQWSSYIKTENHTLSSVVYSAFHKKISSDGARTEYIVRREQEERLVILKWKDSWSNGLQNLIPKGV